MVAVKRPGLVRVALVVVVAVFALAVSGCGLLRSSGEAASSGESAAEWLNEAKAAAGAVAVKRTVWKLHLGGDNAAATHLGDLLKAAPKEPNPEQAAALGRLKALAKFNDEALAAANLASQRWSDVDQGLRTLAITAAADNVKPSVVDHLVEHGKSIVHDAVCQLAWNQLAPNEHTQVHTLIGQGYQVTNVSEVRDLWAMTREAAVGAIIGDAKAAYLKLFYPASLVNWLSYAQGLYDKAAELTKDGTQTIALPDGSVTRAYYYYTRLCLAPPK